MKPPSQPHRSPTSRWWRWDPTTTRRPSWTSLRRQRRHVAGRAPSGPIPLLTGEAQVAAQQLPVANLLAYEDLKRAILQRVARNPEQHRQRFGSVELGDCGRPFVMAQQLRDACRKWLMAEPPYSLRQSLAHPSAAGAAVRPGPACWRCGDPVHFQDHCPMMEVGLLVRVPDSPGAGPDQVGQYQIPVSIKGGTYQALVDSGCNQTSIHQSLIQQRALDTGRKVKVRCVHSDVADYPLVPVSIKFRGKMHRMEVVVNSHLKHPLIFGTDWPGFYSIVGDSMCGCLLADGAGPGGGSGSDRGGASGPVPACLGGNESQRGGETPGAGRLSSGVVAGWGAQKRVRPGPLHWRAASPAGRPPLLPLFFPYKREVVSGNPRCPVKGDDNPVISPQELSGNDFSGTWGRQRHANASWPDSFGRAFTRTSTGGVRRVGNASW